MTLKNQIPCLLVTHVGNSCIMISYVCFLEDIRDSFVKVISGCFVFKTRETPVYHHSGDLWENTMAIFSKITTIYNHLYE